MSHREHMQGIRRRVKEYLLTSNVINIFSPLSTRLLSKSDEKRKREMDLERVCVRWKGGKIYRRIRVFLRVPFLFSHRMKHWRPPSGTMITFASAATVELSTWFEPLIYLVFLTRKKWPAAFFFLFLFLSCVSLRTSYSLPESDGSWTGFNHSSSIISPLLLYSFKCLCAPHTSFLPYSTFQTDILSRSNGRTWWSIANFFASWWCNTPKKPFLLLLLLPPFIVFSFILNQFTNHWISAWRYKQ